MTLDIITDKLLQSLKDELYKEKNKEFILAAPQET